MLHILTVALATFFVWEFLLVVTPVAIPVILQAPVVAELAYWVGLVPERWVVPGAVAGAVGLLHRAALGGATPEPLQIRLPRRRNPYGPPPRGVGSRVPDLP